MNNIPINSGALPQAFCPPTYQAMLDGFAAVMSANISTGGTSVEVVVSAAKPTDTSVLWLQLDSSGRVLRSYIFGQGAWLAAHPLLPGETSWWFDTLPNFTTFDGGDSGAIGPQSGPMWQQALDSNGNVISAQFPVVAGVLPSGAVLSLGGVGGEELHVLTPAEAGVDPNHRHTFGRGNSSWHQIAFETGGTLTTGTPGEAVGGSGDVPPQALADITSFGSAGNNVQTDVPVNALTTIGHNTLPCYVVGYLIQRSPRTFYAIAP